MKTNKIWISILIIGICSVITGLIHLFIKNYALAVWQIIPGIIQLLIALLLKKSEKKSRTYSSGSNEHRE